MKLFPVLDAGEEVLTKISYILLMHLFIMVNQFTMVFSNAFGSGTNPVNCSFSESLPIKLIIVKYALTNYYYG